MPPPHLVLQEIPTADTSIPVPYPNTDATTVGPVTPDRQPAHSQTTHPTTTADAPTPEVPHASDNTASNTP